QRAGDRLVVAAGLGRTVGCGAVDTHFLFAALGQTDGEDERGLSGAALGEGHVADAEGGAGETAAVKGLDLGTKRSGTLHGVTLHRCGGLRSSRERPRGAQTGRRTALRPLLERGSTVSGRRRWAARLSAGDASPAVGLEGFRAWRSNSGCDHVSGTNAS